MKKQDVFGLVATVAVLVGVLWLSGSALFAVQDHNSSSMTWHCGLDDVGATLTLCKTGTTDGNRLYITDIYGQSTTNTGGLFLIRYGTGANCGTGTTSIFPRAAAVARFNYQPNTGLPSLIDLNTPVAVPAGQDICVICTGTNTCTIDLLGRVGP